MSKPLALLAGTAALALGGCGTVRGTAPPVPQPAIAAAACGADRLTPFLNLLPTSDAMAGIEHAAGHGRIRTINPGDAVTMDYRADRLNVEIGVDGRIKRFRCG